MKITFASSRAGLVALALITGAAALQAQATAAPRRGGAIAPAAVYYPGPDHEWQKVAPAQVGMNAARVDDVISFARSQETKNPRNLELSHYQSFGREPFGQGVGPFKERGDQSGVLLRNGYIVAEWGDTHRTDMTFSVTKSFVSTTVGLAYDRGLIRNLNDRVADYMAPIVPFDRSFAINEARAESLGMTDVIQPWETPHNRRITWDHMLRQTSDWEGTLWGKPEWADRPSGEPATWATRAREEPGTKYEYNDVRVNALALAALNVWRRPLPEVMREYVMDPIGASPTWRWYGYDTSWILLDGRPVQSVAGGGHWGGGMFISARDQARFGLFTLRRGKWKDKQLLSEAWVKMATTPTPANTGYGFMNWFLNTDKKMLPNAPASAWVHLGNGTNMVYCDPENDLVIVARWINNNAMDGIVQRAIAAIEGRPASEAGR
ncbi:MAG: serine hydrolase domain-containing protein [Gemmatimonadaceae bacterium]